MQTCSSKYQTYAREVVYVGKACEVKLCVSKAMNDSRNFIIVGISRCVLKYRISNATSFDNIVHYVPP